MNLRMPDDTEAEVNQFFGITRSPGSKHDVPNVNRVTLAKLFHHLNFKVGVEIGVEQGAYSEVLCAENPQAHIYGVDPWQTYPTYREHVTQSKLDAFFETTCQRLAKYQWTPIRKFSVAAAQDFRDSSLDFVYIDGAHNFINVVQDLHAWSAKVRPGGIISGHDYIRRGGRGYYAEQLHVVQVVDAWTEAHDIRPWYVLGSAVAGDPSEIRDKNRSYMWVKE